MLCEHGNMAPCVECDVEPLKAENEALRQQLVEVLGAERNLAVNFGEAFILHKQADAVEAFAKDEGMSWPTTLARGLAAAAKQYAQRLRNQADEAEQASR